MPLGLVAVGSALDPAKYDVRIFDARIDREAASKVIAQAADAACVGLTVFSGPPIASALNLSRELKRRFRDLPIVWGGWHPSILPEQCVTSGAVDAVVIGQGEGAFRELMEVIGDRVQWMNIAGLCVAINGVKPQRTAPRPLGQMESFPSALYDLLDVEPYFRGKGNR